MVKKALIFTLALLMVLVLATPAYAAAPVRYEYYDAGDDAAANCYGATWVAQTFTTTDAHSVTSIRLEAYRVGNPGTFTVSIREVDGSDHPTGLDLSSGTTNADAFTASTSGDWYQITMSSEYQLEASTQYAVTTRAVAGDASNKVVLRFDTSSATYAGGAYELSTNGGVSWATQTDDDLMFEVWGNPVLGVIGAKVFSGYLEDGDWLFTSYYTNEYPPYYPADNPREYFDLQLLSGSTVLAQVKLPAWGNKPGSIYLNAAAAEVLEWGSAYKIRIYGRFGSNPYEEYALTTGDWMGSDLAWLDDWVLSTAGLMETYYGTTLIVYIGGVGEVLNEEGSAVFMLGVPALEVVRPGLFQITVRQPPYEEKEWTEAYQESLDWEAKLGSDSVDRFDAIGDTFGVDGKVIAGVGLFVLYVIAAGVISVSTGSAVGGMVLAIPFLLGGAVTGIIPIAALAVAASIVALLLVCTIWLKGT